MSEKALNTFKSFIASNNAFCAALQRNIITFDDNIIIELIIYYLTLNKDKLKKDLDIQNYPIIQALLDKQEYIIEDKHLVIGEFSIAIEELKSLILELYAKVQNQHKGKIIYLDNAHNKELTIRSHNDCPGRYRVVPFEECLKNRYYELSNREKEYEITNQLTEETINYTKEVQSNYIALVNEIVYKFLLGQIDQCNIKYLKVIAAYLQLYPFTTYIDKNHYVPYEILNINKKRIVLRQSTHDNPQIESLKKELISLLNYQQLLECDQDVEEQSFGNQSQKLTKTEQAILDIEKSKLKIMLEIYELENSPEVYNRNLIEYIAKSFEVGTISINRFFANPILKIFYIEHNQTHFYCSTHLETLLELIDSNQLLGEMDNNHKLRMIIK